MPTVPVPSYKEIDKLKGNKKFQALMDQAIELKGDINVLTEQYDEIKRDLDKILEAAAVEGSVEYNGWRVVVVDKEGKPKVNMKKLLRVLGPKGPSLLRQAMEPGTPSHYVQISPPKAEKEVADDE